MNFIDFIRENHPDPDSLLNPKFEQLCLLAEQYAKYKQSSELLVEKSVMYKATFSFLKDSPRGGTPYWTTEIVPFECKTENELKTKIDSYLENDHHGYHKHIRLTNLIKL